MDISATFITDPQAAELMQPGEGPFDDPAKDAQTAPVGRAPLRQDRDDAEASQSVPMRGRIVGAVPLDPLRTLAWATDLAANRWDRLDQREELRHVVTVGLGDAGRQGDAVAIGDHVMFAPQLPSIRWRRARFFPAWCARTEEESTSARDQSSWWAAWSRSSSTRWSRDQTPARCQSRKRRQQVIPEPQPISWGKAAHGIPVRSTKRIPVRVRRWSSGLRPGYRLRRRLGGGSNGSMTAQRGSSTKGFAMQDSSLRDDSCIG